MIAKPNFIDFLGAKLADAISKSELNWQPMIVFFRDLTRYVTPLSSKDQMRLLQSLSAKSLEILRLSNSGHVQSNAGVFGYSQQACINLAASAVQSGLLESIPRAIFIEAFSSSIYRSN